MTKWQFEDLKNGEIRDFQSGVSRPLGVHADMTKI